MRLRILLIPLVCISFILLGLLSLRFIPSHNKVETIYVSIPTPMPKKEENIFSHPWVAAQSEVKEATLEMIRDIGMLKGWYQEVAEAGMRAGITPNSEEEVTQSVIESLKTLQKELPFTFPEIYYSLLSLPEAPADWYPTPVPFNIYQRLYLDKTDLGLPFYLDVRVFELENKNQAEQIIDWHLDLLSEREELNTFVTKEGIAYIEKGILKEEKDATHGFANLQGERGLFLYCITKKEKLYLAIANAPWSTFQKHLPFFKEVASN